MTTMRTNLRRNERGAALIEAAITIPIILLIAVGIFEFGRAYQTWQVLTNAAREGARVAILIDKTDADVQTAVQNYMKAGGLPEYATAGVGDRAQRRARHQHRLEDHRQLSVQFHGPRRRSPSWSRRAAPPANRSPCSPSRSCGTKARELTMRNRIFAVLAIAILAGGGLAYGTYNLVQNQPAQTAAMATQPVVVAAADLQLGAELKKEDLTVVNFPAGQAPEGTFSQPADLVGRGLIVPVVKNEPILRRKLASKEAGAGLPPVIPEGMRAVSVRVNEVIGVAGYVLPGTRVDVVATASPNDAHADTTSKLILSNVQVLTAGTRMEQDQEKGKPVQVTVVTLLVNPEQSERLALASTEGKIQLALRNPLDQGAPETPGIKTAALVGVGPRRRAGARWSRRLPGARSARSAAPVTQAMPVPEPLPTVEVIRGDKRAQEVIK